MPLYDNRNARTLSRARKIPEGHRLSRRDFAEIKRHASVASQFYPDWQLQSYHKRRRISSWSKGGSRHWIHGADLDTRKIV